MDSLTGCTVLLLHALDYAISGVLCANSDVIARFLFVRPRFAFEAEIEQPLRAWPIGRLYVLTHQQIPSVMDKAAHQMYNKTANTAEPRYSDWVFHTLPFSFEQLKGLVRFGVVIALNFIQGRSVYPVDPDPTALYPLVSRGGSDQDLLDPHKFAERDDKEQA